MINRRDLLKGVIGGGIGLGAVLAGLELKKTPSGFIIIEPENRVFAAGIADLTCDGVNDNIQFQQLLDDLPITGGHIRATGGNYQWGGASVSRAINAITIEGNGRDTYLQRDGVNPLFSLGSTTHWHFKNLRLDAGGIDFGTATYYILENVWIGATYYGFYLATDYTDPDSFNFPVSSTPDSGNTRQAISRGWAKTHIDAPDAHLFSNLLNVQTGKYIWYGAKHGNLGSQAVTANRIVGTIISIPRAVTVTGINIDIITADAGKEIRLLIYNVGTNFAGGSLILNAGKVSVATTGVKNITGFSESLGKGHYFLGAISDGVPVVRTTEITVDSPMGLTTSSLNNAYHSIYKEGQDIDNPPDPFPTPDGEWTVGYIIGLRVASLD